MWGAGVPAGNACSWVTSIAGAASTCISKLTSLHLTRSPHPHKIPQPGCSHLHPTTVSITHKYLTRK